MKNYILLILIFVCITNINAENKEDAKSFEIISSESINEINQNGSTHKDPFEEIINMKGVDVVYISKTLLAMMPDMDDMPGVDIGSIAGKLESMYVISSDSKHTAEKLNNATHKLLSSGAYEALMTVKDDDSLVNFYMKIDDKNKDKSEILMLTKDNDEVSIIRFIGNFTLKDLQDLTKK